MSKVRVEVSIGGRHIEDIELQVGGGGVDNTTEQGQFGEVGEQGVVRRGNGGVQDNVGSPITNAWGAVCIGGKVGIPCQDVFGEGVGDRKSCVGWKRSSVM